MPKLAAFLDGERRVTVGLEQRLFPGDLTGDGGFTVTDGGGNRLSVLKVAGKAGSRRADWHAVTLLLADAPDVADNLRVEKEGYLPAFVLPRLVLSLPCHTYAGEDLGARYTTVRTGLRLWAPTALAVDALFFLRAQDETPFETLPMRRAEGGTWVCEAAGDRHGQYYLYRLRLYQNGAEAESLAVDPYAFGASANSEKALLYDPARTDPPGWTEDKSVALARNTDAVVCEAHVRDMTIHPTSGVPQALRGKYSGVICADAHTPQGSSAVLSHLKELGVTHLELLPTYDYAYGDEREPNDGYTWYNWGYDPVLYNAPEGSYASDADGIARQSEYKQMVQGLHRAGLGLIFDAVYNHTAETGNVRFSVFDKVVPGYFYRTDDAGVYCAGSGCGNDVASERPMVRRFIVDSVRWWMKEYHLDGIRFDLMGLLDRETVLAAWRAARAVNPQAILFGEGWNIPTLLPEKDRMIQRACACAPVGAFNDGFRDHIKGSWQRHDGKGFAQGGGIASPRRFARELMGCSLGPDGIPLRTPNVTVNYVSCHDDLNLWDKNAVAASGADEEELLRMQAFACSIVFTAQGVPFFALGDEFGRSKRGDANSYNNNDPLINPIDWSLRDKNAVLFAYCKGLLALRREHPAFRMASAAQVRRKMHFLLLRRKAVAYVLADETGRVVVAHNGGQNPLTLRLPAGRFGVCAAGMRAQTEPFAFAEGTVEIEPLSTLVLAE